MTSPPHIQNTYFVEHEDICRISRYSLRCIYYSVFSEKKGIIPAIHLMVSSVIFSDTDEGEPNTSSHPSTLPPTFLSWYQ